MAIFQKVVDDETGEDKYVEVGFNELDIPKDVVTSHPEYKKLADRDYKRRQRIKELKAALPAEVDEGEEAPAEDEGTETPSEKPKVEPINKDELFTEFSQRMTAAQVAAAQAEAARVAGLKALLEKYHLADDAMPLLENAVDPNVTAGHLEKSGYSTIRFDDVEGGEVLGERDDKKLGAYGNTSFAAVMKKMGLEKDKSK